VWVLAQPEASVQAVLVLAWASARAPARILCRMAMGKKSLPMRNMRRTRPDRTKHTCHNRRLARMSQQVVQELVRPQLQALVQMSASAQLTASVWVLVSGQAWVTTSAPKCIHTDCHQYKATKSDLWHKVRNSHQWLH